MQAESWSLRSGDDVFQHGNAFVGPYFQQIPPIGQGLDQSLYRHYERAINVRFGAPVPLCRVRQDVHRTAHQHCGGQMTVAMDRALLAVQLLIEGNSIYSMQRIVGVDQNTMMKLLMVAGAKCGKLVRRSGMAV